MGWVEKLFAGCFTNRVIAFIFPDIPPKERRVFNYQIPIKCETNFENYRNN
jgi:hypothetical protein